MKIRQFGGLLLLLGVVAAVALYLVYPDSSPDSPKSITVTGLGGGKVAFVNDPEVIRILKEKYGLTVDFKRVPSLDQVSSCAPGVDFCWPSSQTAAELIKQKPGLKVLSSEIIFNSPIVMYSWIPIVDTLIEQGIVEKSGDTYFITDLNKLIQMDLNGVLWADIGQSSIYGDVQIRSSDPTASNTGNSFAGLLANNLNSGQVVDESSVIPVLPELQKFFNGRGLMPDTTTEMFEQFFTLGMGASPIIVAYESNLIEYCLLHPTKDSQDYISNNVRTLYPKPTVWSSQPMIALTDGGVRLIQALRDPEIQRIGWERHGFRPGVPGVEINANICSIPGVPASIDSVIQMPGPAVMTTIIDALAAPKASAIKREEPFG